MKGQTMPTTVPFAYAAARAELLGSERSVIESNRDLAVVVLFCSIGLALTIGSALLFRFAAIKAALLWTVN